MTLQSHNLNQKHSTYSYNITPNYPKSDANTNPSIRHSIITLKNYHKHYQHQTKQNSPEVPAKTSQITFPNTSDSRAPKDTTTVIKNSIPCSHTHTAIAHPHGAHTQDVIRVKGSHKNPRGTKKRTALYK